MSTPIERRGRKETETNRLGKSVLAFVSVACRAAIVKELPLQHAIEMNRLIQIQMEGSVG